MSVSRRSHMKGGKVIPSRSEDWIATGVGEWNSTAALESRVSRPHDVYLDNPRGPPAAGKIGRDDVAGGLLGREGGHQLLQRVRRETAGASLRTLVQSGELEPIIVGRVDSGENLQDVMAFRVAFGQAGLEVHQLFALRVDRHEGAVHGEDA